MVEEPKNLGDESKGGIELPPDLQVPVPPGPAPAPVSRAPASSGLPHVSSAPPPILAPEPELSYQAPSPPKVPQRKVHHVLGWLWGVLALVVVGGTVYVGLKYINFNQGTIQFTFDPAGVDITIDQKLNKSDVNALAVKVKAGHHTIQVTKEGYLDWEREIDLAQGETATLNVTLGPIPNLNLLLDNLSISFPQLIRQDTLLGFWDNISGFKAVNTATNESISLFDISIPAPQKIVWSPAGAVMVKLAGVKKLPNMVDHRSIKGKYIPLGESPQQGPTYSNGVTTWLLDSERRTDAGLQPVLLSENIRDITFSPDGSQIIYFYEAANGEKSIVMADSIDGSAWMRVVTNVNAANPTLSWLNNDKYVLLLDDAGQTDRVLNILSKELTPIMPDRVPGTPVVSSPNGNKLLYASSNAGGYKLSVWDMADQTTDQTFDQLVTAYTWMNDDTAIVSTTDNNLWYWDLSGKTRPLKFVSTFGSIAPKNLVYSHLLQKLFVWEENRVFSVIA